jgi:hypothetical protein
MLMLTFWTRAALYSHIVPPRRIFIMKRQVQMSFNPNLLSCHMLVCQLMDYPYLQNSEKKDHVKNDPKI